MSEATLTPQQILIERMGEGHWHLTRGGQSRICCGSAGNLVRFVFKSMTEVDEALVPKDLREAMDTATKLVEDLKAGKFSEPLEDAPESEDNEPTPEDDEQFKEMLQKSSEIGFDHFLDRAMNRPGSKEIVAMLRKLRNKQDQRGLALMRASYQWDQPTDTYKWMLNAFCIMLIGMQSAVIRDEAQQAAAALLGGGPQFETAAKGQAAVIAAQISVLDEHLLANGEDLLAA